MMMMREAKMVIRIKIIAASNFLKERDTAKNFDLNPIWYKHKIYQVT